MQENHNYEGEENTARKRRSKHDLHSTLLGFTALIGGLLFQALFNEAVTGSFNKIKAALGDAVAWGVALIVGVSAFIFIKLIFFLYACSNDSPFNFGFRLKVTILHYLSLLVAYPAFLLSVILVSFANCLILLVVSKSYSFHLNDWLYGITSVILIAIVLVVHRLSMIISKKRERDLGGVILDIAYRWISGDTIPINFCLALNGGPIP